MLDCVIRNGQVVTEQGVVDCDVAIKDGVIVALGDAGALAEAEQTLDAQGMYVLPGMIDAHAHLAKTRGSFPSMDNYENATIAAAYGGTTSFIDFAFPYGDQTPQQAMEEKLSQAKGHCYVDYSFHSNLTHADPLHYAQIEELLQSGFPTVKMFTIYRGGRMLEKAGIYEVMRRIQTHGGLAMVHAESAEMIERYIADAVQRGATRPMDHAQCRPPVSELEAMYSVLGLVQQTGAPTLFAHVSIGACAKMIRMAKGELPIFTEVCPHYLVLDESVYAREDACKFVCSPPIRAASEREGLWRMVQEGLVDVVNSDTTDFSLEQKRRFETFFPKMPNGLPTLETRGIVLYAEGVAKGRISIARFAELTATNNAKLMGMYPQKGVLRVGSDADIVVLDPHARQTLSAATAHMQTDYSPYEGLEVTGKVLHTMVRGHWIIRNGCFTEPQFRGSLIRRGAPVLA